MDQYLLLLRSDEAAFRGLTEEQGKEVMGRYMAWTQNLRNSGRLINSNKLEDGSGRVLSGAQKMAVTDGPYAEAKEVLGGYYLLHAASWEEATEICRDCPHLEFGTIEVRRIHVLG